MPPSKGLDEMVQIPRTILRESAKVALRAQIISGAIEGNHVYSIGEIALRLGTSITPVREALVELESLGLVELLRNRGFRVREISGDDIADILDMRLMLEVPAMRRVAASAASQDFTEASALCAESRAAAAAGDLYRYLELDREFHLKLVSMAGNPRLTQTIGNLRDQTRLYGLANMDPVRLVASADDHFPLMERMIAGDEDAVEAIMRDHLSHIAGDWSGSPA